MKSGQFGSGTMRSSRGMVVIDIMWSAPISITGFRARHLVDMRPRQLLATLFELCSMLISIWRILD
jgi:hypothetical protein